MRVAALDIGTNTVLLLIVESQGPPDFRILLDRHAIARIGEGVDHTGIISDAAFERLRTVLRGHKEEIDKLNVDATIAYATSAMRDASNSQKIITSIRSEFGIVIEIISGSTEAELTYRGALAGLSLPEAAQNIGVIDIGGGSTEISLGSKGIFNNGVSIEVGAVRMTERFFNKIPPTRERLNEAVHSIQSLIQEQVQSGSRIDILIAVAGTPTTLAAMDLNLQQFDRDQIQDYELKMEAVERLVLEIESLSTDELVKKYPAVNRGRADILLAGSLILQEAMKALRMQSVIVSTRGLRYGIAIQELERGFALPKTNWAIAE